MRTTVHQSDENFLWAILILFLLALELILFHGKLVRGSVWGIRKTEYQKNKAHAPKGDLRSPTPLFFYLVSFLASSYGKYSETRILFKKQKGMSQFSSIFEIGFLNYARRLSEG